MSRVFLKNILKKKAQKKSPEGALIYCCIFFQLAAVRIGYKIRLSYLDPPSLLPLLYNVCKIFAINPFSHHQNRQKKTLIRGQCERCIFNSCIMRILLHISMPAFCKLLVPSLQSLWLNFLQQIMYKISSTTD